MSTRQSITVMPATQERWDDFVALMGPRGGAGGCWCMLWRLRNKEYSANKGEVNRELMRLAFAAPTPPGLLGYDGGQAVAWLSVAPRATFVRLETSRILQPVDEVSVWSVSCFLIRPRWRRSGVAVALLEAAKGFVRQNGGTALEGYPVDPPSPSYPETYAWTGFAESFRRAGFSEILRRSPTRPVMRCVLA